MADTDPSKTPGVNKPGPESIQAPWRMSYLESLEETERRKKAKAAEADGMSFLRHYWLNPHDDLHNNVVHRSDVGMILLNKYPYANGHLLVALGDAKPTLLDYDGAQRAHLWQLVELATDAVQRTLTPQGINIGINQGRAAGAGVPDHLHVHLVPRWGGDTNFITVVGQVRVNPAALDDVASKYREVIARIVGS